MKIIFICWFPFQSGFTPLHIASHYGNVNVGTLLIQRGADVNFRAKVILAFNLIHWMLVAGINLSMTTGQRSDSTCTVCIPWV
jgi:hypothetical protein